MASIVDPADVAAATPLPPVNQIVSPEDVAKATPVEGGSIVDALKSLLTGFGRGIPEGYGMVGDIANAADLGYGKLTGDTELADKARSGLQGNNGFDFGTNAIAKALNDAGILTYKPSPGLDEGLYNVGHFTGSVLGPGAVKLGVQAVKEGLIPAGMAAAKLFGIGVGGGVGNEAGREVANNYVGDDSPWTRFALEAGGGLFGGLAGGGLMNRAFFTETPAVAKDFDALGVKPRFASDLTDRPGPAGYVTSNWLPGRFGAQGVSKASAEATQGEISKAATDALAPDWMGVGSLQSQGENIQSLASKAVTDLRAETTAKFQKLDTLITPTDQVATTDTNAAIGNLVNRADDPAIKAIVSNPTFTKYAALLAKPSLSWNDMQILRSEIGSSMDGAEGTELGLLKQMYKGVTSDMQRMAAKTPGAGAAFDDAMQTAETNGEFTRGILKDVVNKPSPEGLPGYFTQQGKQGATRLDSLTEAAGLSDPEKAELGRLLLGNQARGGGGQFDIDKLMQFWSTASPEMRAALTRDPALQRTMGQLERVYGATAQSRGLIGESPTSVLHDPLSMLTGGATALDSIMAGHSGLGTSLSAAAAAAAPPVAFNLAARAAQRPGMASILGRQLTPNAISPGASLGAVAPAIPANTTPDLFPSTYVPKPQATAADSPAGQHVQPMDWLATADRPSAIAYVAIKLGPQVAAQMPKDDTGYRAALFSLFSNPETRKKLTMDQPVTDEMVTSRHN